MPTNEAQPYPPIKRHERMSQSGGTSIDLYVFDEELPDITVRQSGAFAPNTNFPTVWDAPEIIFPLLRLAPEQLPQFIAGLHEAGRIAAELGVRTGQPFPFEPFSQE